MRVHLGLGSNLGNRAENLRGALRELAADAHIELTALSHAYETAPWGVTDQPAFLNMAAEIETDLSPLELLNVAKEVEARLGRVRTQRWGPRKIDIDIILWGDQTLESDALTLPHPGFRERPFVLIPLAEIAPGAADPVTGKTVADLARDAGAPEGAAQRQHITP